MTMKPSMKLLNRERYPMTSQPYRPCLRLNGKKYLLSVIQLAAIEEVRDAAETPFYLEYCKEEQMTLSSLVKQGLLRLKPMIAGDRCSLQVYTTDLGLELLQLYLDGGKEHKSPGRPSHS